MLLSLLRLPTKKWAEYVKAMGHRFPKNESEYSDMKLTIVRERALEQQVGDLTIIGDGRSQGPRHYWAGEGESPLPLYLCLGQPTANPEDDGHYFMGPSGESSEGVTSLLPAMMDPMKPTILLLYMTSARLNPLPTVPAHARNSGKRKTLQTPGTSRSWSWSVPLAQPTERT